MCNERIRIEEKTLVYLIEKTGIFLSMRKLSLMRENSPNYVRTKRFLKAAKHFIVNGTEKKERKTEREAGKENGKREEKGFYYSLFCCGKTIRARSMKSRVEMTKGLLLDNLDNVAHYILIISAICA